MKHLNKLISMVLCFIMCLSLYTPILALNSNNSEGPISTKEFRLDESSTLSVSTYEYGVSHTITFPDPSTIESEINTAIQNEHNYQMVESYIQSMDIDNTLKNRYMNTIEQEYSTADYIEKCSFLVPNLANSSSLTYYGTYNGRTFYTRPYMNIVSRYKRVQTKDLNTINAWISGTKNLVLAVGAVELSLFFSFMDIADKLLSKGYTAQPGDYLEYYLYADKEIRDIVTPDDKGYVGDDYCTVIQEASALCHPYIKQGLNYRLAGASEAIFEAPKKYDFWCYSIHYEDKNYNLQKGYERYNTVPDYPLALTEIDILSDSRITWEWHNS